MTGTNRPAIRLGVASPSDVLCLEVATQLVDVIDGVPMAPESAGLAEWSAWLTDGSGRQRAVEIARVPFERDALERRRAVLGSADAVLLAADATMDAMPIVQAALAEVQTTGAERAAPIVVFGIGPSAGDGPDADAVRAALSFEGGDVVIAAGSSDRDGLRHAFELAMRAALGPSAATSTPTSVPVPETVAAPTPTPTPETAPEATPASGDMAPPTSVPPVAPYGVELNPAAAAGGSVEINATVWSALAELIGGIDPGGDPHRSLLVSGLLAHGIVVERHEIAGADAMWLQPVVTPAASAQPAGRAADAAAELRELKDLRQNVVG